MTGCIATPTELCINKSDGQNDSPKDPPIKHRGFLRRWKVVSVLMGYDNTWPRRSITDFASGQVWSTSMSEVTRILTAIKQGDPAASEQLLPVVYEELRRLAAQRLAQEKPGQTLQATGSCMRRICAWSATTVRNKSGKAEATSLPPRPRPCAAL